MSHSHHHQLILFGPPGTSKSRRARDTSIWELGAARDNIIPVTFHSDYSYGDFVARLLPISKDDGRVHYSVHAGPFIRSLAIAYRALALADTPNVVLLIDEINRGNCAEIFGDIFQLLDRDDDGWSSYEISVSDLVVKALKDEMGGVKHGHEISSIPPLDVADGLMAKRQIKLPPNLFLIGTMNTSDESVYFMDSAFKRRWNFEFHPVGFDDVPDSQRHAVIAGSTYRWSEFVDGLNGFILDRCASPKMDDKLIGPWFIKARLPKRHVQTIEQRFPEECNKIAESAAKVDIYFQGAEHSESVETAVLELANRLPPMLGQKVKDLAGYKVGDRRVFSAIHSSNGDFPYYIKKDAANPYRLGIEGFVSELRRLPAEELKFEIDRTAVAGKLMLYLWDNVFDRDKSPLAVLLGIEPRSLRTFGQFTDQVDAFIERVCARTSSVPDDSVSIDRIAAATANNSAA